MTPARPATRLALALGLGACLGLALHALPLHADECPQGEPAPPAAPEPQRAGPAEQEGHGIPVASTGRAFATPEEAATALFQALEAPDLTALRELLGEGSDDVLDDGSDPVVAKRRADVAALGRRSLEVREQGERRVLALGEDGWELPLLLLKTPEGWRFDLASAHEEIHARVIGRNELDAIQLLSAYAALQEAYFAEDRDGDGVREYAQRLISTPGQKDGLWWAVEEGEAASPLAGVMEPMTGEEREPEAGARFAGYRWRTLLAQGVGAPGGAYPYVLHGNMVAGYALVAWPATYRKSGVQTFLVSRNGEIYQRDLGPETARLADSIRELALDAGWTKVDAHKELGAERIARAGTPPSAPKAE
jgi:hypothetical protein